MLLMDSISYVALTKGMYVAHAYAEEVNAVNFYREIYQKMVSSPRPPRFIFDSKAIETVTELTLGRPKTFRDAMSQVSIPYPKMWIEWEEAGRQILRDRFNGNTRPELPVPARIGFYIEAEPGKDKSKGLRRGSVTWVWQHAGTNIPCISPLTVYFNLDEDFPPKVRLPDGGYIISLLELWQGHPVQLESLKSIWRTCMHLPNSYGFELTDALQHNKTLFDRLTANAFADIVGEYIMVWGVMLMLAKNRERLIVREVNQSKLNKARAKQRKIPLLDYTSIQVNLNRLKADGVLRSPLGYIRKSPRIHLVSSYLKSNGKIVLPYTRGIGGDISRKISVTA